MRQQYCIASSSLKFVIHQWDWPIYDVKCNEEHWECNQEKFIGLGHSLKIPRLSYWSLGEIWTNLNNKILNFKTLLPMPGVSKSTRFEGHIFHILKEKCSNGFNLNNKGPNGLQLLQLVAIQVICDTFFGTFLTPNPYVTVHIFKNCFLILLGTKLWMN